MFILKKNRIVVYSYLFKEGTIVVKKDFYLEKHSEEVDIPNVEVMALLKSFKSKGLVKETFNWNYYYYYLTTEGIDYLRQYLALPADIIPATLKVSANKPAVPTGRPQQEDRRRDGKSFGPGGDFKPRFEGGRGGQGGRGGRDGYRGGRE